MPGGQGTVIGCAGWSADMAGGVNWQVPSGILISPGIMLGWPLPVAVVVAAG